MEIIDAVKKLDITVVTGEELLEKKITSVYVGDLLSVVMGKAKENCAWITVQSHINIVAVASLVDMACIIVAEGFKIDEDAIAKAKDEDIILLASKKTAYEVAKELVNAGV